MEVTLKDLKGRQEPELFLGFNPCFNGSDSKRCSGRKLCTLRITIVSILVLMEVTLKGGGGSGCGNSSGVSILVLMEVTLKETDIGVAEARQGRFNPCFNGSDSKR